MNAEQLAQDSQVEGAIDRLANRIRSEGPLVIPRAAIMDFLSEVLTVYHESLVTEDAMEAAAKAMAEGTIPSENDPHSETPFFLRCAQLAAPILLAPHLQEIERLKAENAALDRTDKAFNDRLAAAEARVRELGDAVRGLLHVIRADQLVPESVGYMKMAAKAVGMEAE